MADYTNIFPCTFLAIKDMIFIFCGFVQQPAPKFPHKPFFLGTAVILAFLHVTSQGKIPALFDSNPAIYYVAVTGFLMYCLAYGFDAISSSHPFYPISPATGNVLHRCMFLAGSLSFAATASFLFPEFIRAVLFAFIFSTISACALLYWVYQKFVQNQGSTRVTSDLTTV